MKNPTPALQLCRQSVCLIQTVILGFVLSLGVAIATPAIQVANTSPDTQIICLGSGGMKTVTFTADGTAVEVQTTHDPQCLLCAALLALPSTNQADSGWQAISDVPPKPAHTESFFPVECLVPPARAPPLSYQT